ncbi:histidine phosphatase family protein [Candidatus Parcubacteria bacterium]|nr:histidine phosphatase family protein [Candidatus Parcubacteria bacterium]
MRLIITRHGETIENINRICQGQTDGQLSKKGIEQAKKLGIRFKDRKIDAIYSSDLKRTVDTAKEILKYHPSLKLNLDKRIRERFFGKLQGNLFPNNWDWKNIPEDVETSENIYKRAKEFIDDVYLKYKNKTVLVVCHGGIKKALLTVIHNKHFSEFGIWEKINNTSVSEFDIEENGNHKIHILNCTSHLE